MGEYRDENWTIDVAWNSPSVFTKAPVGQPTVRLFIAHGPVQQAFDLPADAAEALVKALPACIQATRESFERAYGKTTA